MPSVSIYLPDDLYERILTEVDDVDRDGNFSPWLQHIVRRELDGEYDDLEQLTKRIEELEKWKEETQEWREDVMDELVQKFTGDFARAE